MTVLCSPLRQVLLDEPRAQMHVNLDQRIIANALKGMDFAGLDHENVSSASFELLAVDHPEPPALPHELHFIIGMFVGPWTAPREGSQKEDRDVHVSIV